MLKNLSFKPEYRSEEDDLKNDFFLPCLKRAIQYDRAVGYFSSKILLALCDGVKEFIKNNGRMRIITSIELHEDDIKSITSGITKRQIIEEKIYNIIAKEQYVFENNSSCEALERAIELDLIEIKIAIPKNIFGIYHEKLGIFYDEHSNYVTFSGSANESQRALEDNYECIDIFTSWNDTERAHLKKTHFDNLWGEKKKHIDVIDFPEAAKKEILRIVKKTISKKQIDKWVHQKRAIEIFMSHNRGILQMATGTGKTRTAIQIINQLVSDDKIDAVIITADGNDLLAQWYKEILLHLKKDSPFSSVYRHYDSYKEKDRFECETNKKILIVSRPSVHKALDTYQGHSRSLIINDEVHKLGSPNNCKKLAGKIKPFKYNLGLSATPEREYDEDGTAFIKDEIGDVIFEFNIEDAIEHGILCEMEYIPIEYFTTEEDKARIKDVYKKKAAREIEGTPMSDQELWTALAFVHKTSKGKLSPFKNYIKTNQHILQGCIIFVETMEYGKEILNIIHEHISNFHTYFQGDPPEVLDRFSKNNLSCLVTCHRLSEGIDIRSLQTVILLSASKARLETIQRIGRCLRVDPKKPDKRATVIDFIRSNEGMDNSDTERCAWLTSLSTIRRSQCLSQTT